MRQRLSEKKVNHLKTSTGLPIVHVLVRGNTGHRKDLCLENGLITYLWPSGELEETTHRWKPEGKN